MLKFSLQHAAVLVLAGAACGAQANSVVIDVGGSVKGGASVITVDANTSTKTTIDAFTVTSLSDVYVDFSSLENKVKVGPVTVTQQPITFSNPTLGSYTFTGTAGAGSLVGVFSKVAAGTYFLKFGSLESAKSGGTWSGKVTVTSVPEPVVSSMTLAGLGVVGLSLYRRRTKR